MTWNEPQAQDTLSSRPFGASAPEPTTQLDRAGGQPTAPVPFAWEAVPRQVKRGRANTTERGANRAHGSREKRGTERRGRLLRLMRAHRILSVTLLASILLLALAGVVGAVPDL